MSTNFGKAMVVGVTTLIFTLMFAGNHLARNDWNPTVFTAVGEDDQAIRDYAEARLDDVILRPQLGHDGRFFFVQGNDPWLLDPDENAAVLDRPTYRSQRMLYPILASLGGTLGPEGVTWGMVIVNILAMAGGASAAAAIAIRLGGSQWWGLAFPLNIGLISEFSVGGAGIVAAAAAFGAILFLMERRLAIATLLIVASVLSREVMVLTAIGGAGYLLFKGKRQSAFIFGISPVIAAGVWALFLRVRLPSDGDVVAGNLGPPLAGFIRNLPNWFADPVELAVGLVTVLVLVFLTIRAVRTPTLLAWGFVLFAPLAFLLTEPVWDGYFNISRAVAPVYTAYILLAFAANSDSEQVLTSRAGVAL